MCVWEHSQSCPYGRDPRILFYPNHTRMKVALTWQEIQPRSCGQFQCDSEVGPVSLPVSHGLVMHCRPRQPSSPLFSRNPLAWALCHFSPAGNQQGSPVHANSSPAWCQAPVDRLNPALTHHISWILPPLSTLTSFTTSDFLRVTPKIRF